MELSEFREKLQLITESGSAENWYPQIDALRASYPHTIRLRNSVIDRFANCFAFALELDQWPTYRSAARKHWSNCLANASFVAELIDTGVLRKDFEGSLLIFSDENGAQHAGRRDGSCVVSKWGSGPVFEHAEFEIPSGCGVQVCSYRFHDRSALEAAFIRIVGDSGFGV